MRARARYVLEFYGRSVWVKHILEIYGRSLWVSHVLVYMCVYVRTFKCLRKTTALSNATLPSSDPSLRREFEDNDVLPIG